MNRQNGRHPEINIHPTSKGFKTFYCDGLVGSIYFDADDFEQPESIVVIRDGEEDSPATIGITGVSQELARSSLEQVLQDLR